MVAPVFITGNQNKADYLSAMLDMPLEHQKIDLDEIQSIHLEEIVERKVKQAYEKVGKPVLVEDVGLSLSALGGLPGPFIKFFVEAPNGLEMICRMIDSFEDRSARAECVFGYYDGTLLELFRGGMDGVIVNHPIGDGGYGWDKVFAPIGYDSKTRAQLSDDDDRDTYIKIKPFTEVKQFLQNTESGT